MNKNIVIAVVVSIATGLVFGWLIAAAQYARFAAREADERYLLRQEMTELKQTVDDLRQKLGIEGKYSLRYVDPSR